MKLWNNHRNVINNLYYQLKKSIIILKMVAHLSGQRCQLPGFGLKDPGAGLQDTLSMILAGDSV